jgi:hypothetical protein
MLSSKKYTLWGLKSNRKPLEPKYGILKIEILNFYKSCDLSIAQKFYVELKKVMRVMRAQKREIQISRVKNFTFSFLYGTGRTRNLFYNYSVNLF